MDRYQHAQENFVMKSFVHSSNLHGSNIEVWEWKSDFIHTL